jgi:pSer/pThr/pTyr-binding forkhead associated (FHA) protein
MTAPPKVLAMIERAHGLTEEAFVETLGGWALVGPPVVVSDDEWSYRTLSSRTVQDISPDGELIIMRDTHVVHVLKKGRPGPFADTVLIGRSSSNDVVLEHTSVSKLHARAKLDANGNPTLSDAGSSNGTKIAGEGLPPGEWRPLTSGDVVAFGSCMYNALEPKRLYKMLNRFKKA